MTQAVLAWDAEIGLKQGTNCTVIDAEEWYLFLSLLSFPWAQQYITQDESHLVRTPIFNLSTRSLYNSLCRLDGVGMAVLSHDFGALDGKDSDVARVLNAFNSSANASHNLVILAQRFPSILKLPLPRAQFAQKFNLIIGKICHEMLARSRKEKEIGGTEQGDKSCLGLLCEFCPSFPHLANTTIAITVKAEQSGNTTGLTEEEVGDEV